METLSRTPLRRIVPLVFIERPVEFEPIRQHDDGLGAALTLIHRESDRLFPVHKQAAAKAVGVLDDPAAGPILSDEQTGRVGGARSFDVVVDHSLCLVLSRGPGRFFWRVHRLKLLLRRRSMGRKSDQKLSHEAERERYRQQHAEAGENLQGLGRFGFIRIVSIHTA
jgi:hypothetical protein